MVSTEVQELVSAGRFTGCGQELLQHGEAEVPKPVLQTIRFLSERKVWFQLSRNHPAFSCRDAANKRRRLGHEGIGLWDELKSFLGRFERGGQTRYVIAHCRGDRQLDFALLRHAVQADTLPERLREDELAQLGLEYGLVNPFETWGRFVIDGPLLTCPILQVFDRELLTPMGFPGTMMTNAGDFTWAVEFDAKALFARLDLAEVADISVPDPEADPRPPYLLKRGPIGILTGNAPESGMALWQNVNDQTRSLLGERCLGDISMPEVIVHSLPALGLTMELDSRHERVWAELCWAAKGLLDRGVGSLAVACNTTHYFTQRLRSLCHEFGAELMSMPESLALWLRAHQIERVSLVGIRLVADLGPWSAYRDALVGFEVERLSGRALQQLQEVAYQVKAEGTSEAALNRMRDILSKEVSADCVILALTELSMLLARQRKKGKSGKLLVDPLAVYGEALAKRYLGLPFP
ncbi:MAG: hypothetical protein HC897_04950 [Thermoanaerobaculia bacterium]|nr:hypothetical protein [Thermoanaerobaculia bacterium]